MRYTQRILAATALAVVASRVGAQELQSLPGEAATAGDLVPVGGGEGAAEATAVGEPAMGEPAMETAEEPAVVEETAAPAETEEALETVSLFPGPFAARIPPVKDYQIRGAKHHHEA